MIAPRFKAIALCMMGAVLALSFALGLPWLVIAIQALCIAGAAAFILTRPSGPR